MGAVSRGGKSAVFSFTYQKSHVIKKKEKLLDKQGRRNTILSEVRSQKSEVRIAILSLDGCIKK